EIYERLSEFEFSVKTDSKISVIVNSSTASAGELFTETLRDYGVSNTIGVTTYGKGSMQSFVYLSGRDTSMGVLKISANSYTSAYSESYNGIGIVPDYEIELDGKAALTSLWLLSKEDDAQFITAYNLLNPDGKLDMPDESEYIIND
ncbi:MAG: S41 family peptidase, partial [Clostridia bacterium]|nr:S41 family peptidase [Clostridia bacterium]